jgi:ATP-dependent Clp protease, protease subunit
MSKINPKNPKSIPKFPKHKPAKTKSKPVRTNEDEDDIDTESFSIGQLLGSNSNKDAPEDDYTETEYYLYSDVSISSVMGLLKFIKRAEKRWDAFLSDYKDILDINTAKPKALKIYINSNGGELFAAIPLIDAIANSKIPIHTYIEGMAASAASLIAMAGHKRFITKNSFMLIHELRTGVEGTFSNVMDEHENCIKLMNVIKKLYVDRSVKAMELTNSHSVDEINSHKNKFEKLLSDILKRDLILTADECITHCLVDQIV